MRLQATQCLLTAKKIQKRKKQPIKIKKELPKKVYFKKCLAV